MAEDNLKEISEINISELNNFQLLTIFNLFDNVSQEILDVDLKTFQSNLINEGITRGLFKMKKE